jgi:hypothetical protein
MTAGKYLVYVTIISIFAVFISGAYLSGSGFGAACGVGGTSFSSNDGHIATVVSVFHPTGLRR